MLDADSDLDEMITISQKLWTMRDLASFFAVPVVVIHRLIEGGYLRTSVQNGVPFITRDEIARFIRVFNNFDREECLR